MGTPGRGLTILETRPDDPRNHRSEAQGSGNGRGKHLPEGMEGYVEDVILGPQFTQKATWMGEPFAIGASA